MLITLFVFEIILIILTVFTTHMVEHKFASIQASLGMYCSKRTYKTKADIHFIEMVLADYKRLCSDTDEEPDLPSAISLKLHKEYIGRFSYVAVMNVANKVRHLMWGIFGAEVLIAGINEVTDDGKILMLIFSSLLMTVIMCFYGIIKGLNEKQETLIDEVTHYIRNVYPVEVKERKKVVEERNNSQNNSVLNHTNVTQFDEIKKQGKYSQKQVQENEEVTQPNTTIQEENITDKLRVNESHNKAEINARDIAQLLKNL